MSAKNNNFKIMLINMAIKCMPKFLIKWVANTILKGIANLKDFNVNLGKRTVYFKLLLLGEDEAIEVWLHDFAVYHENDSYHFMLRDADSNKLWMTNILARFVNRVWVIPNTPLINEHIDLLAELLHPLEIPSVEDAEKKRIKGDKKKS